MKKHIISLLVLLVIFILLCCLIPVQATNLVDTTSNELEQHLSSQELFCLRKAYPYEYKALHYQEYFNGIQTNPDALEQVISSSTSVPSSVGMSGPMNSSWPTQSYNAQRTSRTYVSTSDNPGIEKWRFKTFGSGGVDSGAVIDIEGNIYFGCKDFVFYALWSNGTFRWSYETAEPIWSVPALAEDGTIYITSCDWYLYALYPNGNLKWKFNTGQIVSASPVIADDGTIYIGHSQGRVFAINPNGTEQWHYDLPNDIYGSAALGLDGMIYIGCWDNRFYALNPNGTLKWSFPTGDKVKGVPSLAPDGTIYFGSWDGYLYALYPNGTMRWRCGVGSGTETTPAIAADGTIYVGGDELYAVYPNGTMRWTFNLGTNRHIFTSCPAIAAEGTIYVGVDVGEVTAGEILAVHPNGTERWRKIISDEWVDASPAIGPDGTVYIGSSGGGLGRGLHAFGSINSNQPPNPPSIDGKNPGKPREEYWYAFPAIDPDNNPVTVFIDWGDGNSEWSYEGASGESIWVEHAWMKKGTYTIKAKARDVLGLESNWSTMEVTMPYSYEPPQFPFIHWLLERFPNAFPLLRYLVGFIQYL
ncbi:MAG TPA: PQQ-binding-like beta-propeller repeat protein [Candidatus Thermoplasmatota archaeon]|nr:PQQ-binding-like beta-propeller repeat protein [Candidatus Thermoplasmatota archaeon]